VVIFFGVQKSLMHTTMSGPRFKVLLTHDVMLLFLILTYCSCQPMIVLEPFT